MSLCCAQPSWEGHTTVESTTLRSFIHVKRRMFSYTRAIFIHLIVVMYVYIYKQDVLLRYQPAENHFPSVFYQSIINETRRLDS